MKSPHPRSDGILLLPDVRLKPETIAAPAFTQKELGEASLKGFFMVARAWGLSTRDQLVLLGLPSKATYLAWKADQDHVIPADSMERISYLLGIWKALRTLIPDDAQAVAWVKNPNDNPMFEGRPPLERMLRGRVFDLADIKRLLMARIGTW
jgi:hypothetical protein